jgi:hypothetical protein
MSMRIAKISGRLSFTSDSLPSVTTKGEKVIIDHA